MRLAIFSDTHGNCCAFDRILQAVRKKAIDPLSKMQCHNTSVTPNKNAPRNAAHYFIVSPYVGVIRRHKRA